MLISIGREGSQYLSYQDACLLPLGGCHDGLALVVRRGWHRSGELVTVSGAADHRVAIVCGELVLHWLTDGRHSNDLVLQLTCIVSAVSQSNCSLTDRSCICTTEDITAASEPCIRSSCTIKEALREHREPRSVFDMLRIDSLTQVAVTQRLQADSCSLPVRNRSGLLRREQWVCFGLAIAAVTFRVIAKLPMWNGPDLWWDDYTAVASLLIFVGSNVLLYRCKLLAPMPDTRSLRR